MNKAVLKYIQKVTLASFAAIIVMMQVTNLFNDIKIESIIEENKKAIQDIISVNRSYLIQELYLGNNDALQKRVYSLKNQIFQSTGQLSCLKINDISSCNETSDKPIYTLKENLLNSQIIVSVFPIKNRGFYKEFFYVTLLIILFFIILISYWNLKNSLIPYLKSKEELEIKKQIQISNDKICHDIKSPLTSLEFFLGNIESKLTENDRLIGRQALERINDIIQTLVTTDSSGDDQEKSQKTIIFPLIKRIVSEKRVEYKNIPDLTIAIEDNSKYGLFSMINKATFLRSISNLINNSVEAKADNRPLNITIFLSNDDQNISIVIKDNGKGIPKEKLQSIFERGVSFNKEKGKGIGLSEAKTYVEKIGGVLSISSTENVGTSVEIKLKIVTPPTWFQRKLKIPFSTVCIIDDDPSIHTLWEQKFENYEINILHFNSSESFENWAITSTLEDVYFLFDLELIGSSSNGIELIKKYDLSKNSTLVTSHYNNETIKNECNDIGLNIIPKESVKNIILSSLKKKPNRIIVLIDDDPLVHSTWEMAAEVENDELHCYFSVQDFINNSGHYKKTVPIFVDSNLSNGLKGEIESKKIFHLGFKNITLATGRKLKNLPLWINCQQGKDYPSFS